MKTTLAMMVIIMLVVTGVTYAAGGPNSGYSGTGAGRGGFTSKTGLVKERGDEEDHMDGKESSADKATEPADGDVPPGDDNNEKDDPKN